MRFERALIRRVGVGAAIALCAVTSLAGTAGCASNSARTYQTQEEGERGFRLPGFGRRARTTAAQADSGVLGVNAFLWRASLDTLSFMPLASADPYGGLIITDWYSNPEKLDERFKATVYILDTRLRADGLNVAIAKQNRATDGQWRDAPTSPQTETDIENAILTRARQLRVNGR
jgi:hypothetical protein